MRAVAKLPQLKVLNLYDTIWRQDAIALGAEYLPVCLPHLLVFNAPESVLVRLLHLPACCCQQNCAVDVPRCQP